MVARSQMSILSPLACLTFSVAGKQLGDRDERNLFPAAIRITDETRPKAVMIEKVRAFLSPVFEECLSPPVACAVASRINAAL